MGEKAIILDRDGVINKEITGKYVTSEDEFFLLPNIEKNLLELKKMNFKLYVVTNQSAVNRNLVSIEELKKIHAKMKNLLEASGSKISGIYYCPHTPEENCGCRKPNTGLILQVIKENNIDITKSWLIGDKDSDIIAGKSAGLKTIKISTNEELKNAVQIIKQNEETLD